MEDGKKILSEDIIPSLKAKVEAKQDKLTAGNNITITNDNVISASGAAGANNGKLTIEKNGTEVGSFTADQATDTAINITVPTTATEVGALADTTKYAANIVMNMDTANYQITTTLKDQDGNSIGNPQTIDLPLESVVVSGAYNAATKEVELTLEDGSKVSFSVADLVAGLQTEITDANKLNADLVDDTTATHKFSTAAEKTKLSGLANIKSVGSGLNLNASTGELTANTPPTVNNATITIQRNGVNVDSFTVNQATNKSINIAVPTTVASLSDAGQYAKKTDLPTVNNGTLTIQRNGTNVATFTANQSGTSTANISVPNITTTATDPGEGSALAANNYIGVYGQTSDLVETNDIADGAVTSAKIGSEAVLNQHLAPNSVTADNVDWTTLSGDKWPLINTATSNNNINNKVDYEQYSFTVPASGRYFVSFTQQLGSNAATGYGLTLKIKLDSTTVCQSGAAIAGNPAYMYGVVSCAVSAKSGQAITCTATGGSTNSTSTANGRVSLARIA